MTNGLRNLFLIAFKFQLPKIIRTRLKKTEILLTYRPAIWPKTSLQNKLTSSNDEYYSSKILNNIFIYLQIVLNWISHVMSRNISHVLVIRTNFSIFQKKTLDWLQVQFDEKKAI